MWENDNVSGLEREVRFPRPEVMVALKCDVHPWMRSWVGVVDHPFFAVSGPDGSFAIAGLPQGEYEVEAWHEVYGRKTAKVAVRAGEKTAVEFRFALPRRGPVTFELFDVAGRRVRILARSVFDPGWHTLTWDGSTGRGRAGAGLYFARFRAEGQSFVRRLIWLH